MIRQASAAATLAPLLKPAKSPSVRARERAVLVAVASSTLRKPSMWAGSIEALSSARVLPVPRPQTRQRFYAFPISVLRRSLSVNKAHVFAGFCPRLLSFFLSPCQPPAAVRKLIFDHL